MTWFTIFSTHMTITLLFIFIFGAVIGSFLNVVIYRYPIMLELEWNHDCSIQLNLPTPPTETLNLCMPVSHCPHCKKPIPWWCNIPIVSYVLLCGKCAWCHHTIASRYLWVELLSAVLSVIVVLQWGLSWQAGALLLFTYILIALSFIDLKHQFLPDTMTLSLLWIGLLFATQSLFISPTQAIFGALVGYLFLWSIAKIYLLLRKKEGMGLGDCKMLAMTGAWTGPLALVHVLLIATLSALLVSVVLIMMKKLERQNPIPFGPFIGIGAWIVLMFHATLNEFLFRMMQ